MPPPTPVSAETRALPESLRPLFWEYDFDTLSWTDDRDLVIGRVLAHGPWPSVKWLWRRVGDDGLREWIEKTCGRSLDRKRLSFWRLILDLPGEQVDRWLEERAENPWENRWVE
jgi:hypothetical protein